MDPKERLRISLRAPLSRPARASWLPALIALLACAAPACSSDGGSFVVADTGAIDDVATDDTAAGDADPGDTGVDADDGGAFPVRRLPCVPSSQLATDLPALKYGSVEGDLVAIIPPGTSTNCPEDSGHVHLQLDVNGKRYDVAVNVESTGGQQMGFFEKDLAPKLDPLGYSNSAFDYRLTLGANSTMFTSASKSALVSKIQSVLKNAGRVSIHGLTYGAPDAGTGIHNVHYNGPGRDGAIVVRRGGANLQDHVLAMKFSTDTF